MAPNCLLLDNLSESFFSPDIDQTPFVDLSNTVWAQEDLTKQPVGSKCGSHEHNSHIKYCDL